MDIELNLVIGTSLLVLAIPSLISAAIDRRFPLVALIVAVCGLGLILWVALAMNGAFPDTAAAAKGFATGALFETIKAVPHAFIEIAGRVITYFF